MRRALVIASVLVLAAAAPHRTPSGTLVPLRAQPGTELDRAARTLLADDLAAAASRGDRPLVLIGTAALGGSRPALFVQLQSPKECGSAGCTTSVYVANGNSWRRVLDGTTGRLAVAPTRTRGMADLLSDDDRFVWTGTTYRSTQPAPAVDLTPRHPRRHR